MRLIKVIMVIGVIKVIHASKGNKAPLVSLCVVLCYLTWFGLPYSTTWGGKYYAKLGLANVNFAIFLIIFFNCGTPGL